MRKLFKVDIYSFNILLGIITPAIVCLFLFNYHSDLSKFSYTWLFTTDFFKGIVIVFSYSLPLAFFSSKLYQLFDHDEVSKLKQITLIITSLAFLPFGLILLFVLAKIHFIAVIALAAGILYGYVNTYKLKPALIKLT